MFFELPGSVVWCLTLIWGKFLVIIALNISLFCLFAVVVLLWYSLMHRYTFCSCLTILGYSGGFFFRLFLFVFQFWRFLLRYPQAQRFFLQLSSLLISPSKALFFYLSVFFLSLGFLFSSFLKFPFLCLYAVYFIH